MHEFWSESFPEHHADSIDSNSVTALAAGRARGASPLRDSPPSPSGLATQRLCQGSASRPAPALDTIVALLNRISYKLACPQTLIPQDRCGGSRRAAVGGARPQRGATARAPQPQMGRGAQDGGRGTLPAQLLSLFYRKLRTARACYDALNGLISVGEDQAYGSQDDESCAARVTC